MADARIAELEMAVNSAADQKDVTDRKLQGFREQVNFLQVFILFPNSYCKANIFLSNLRLEVLK